MDGLPFGAQTLPHGGVRFGLWAPAADAVALHVDGRIVPVPQVDGWCVVVDAQAGAGSRYTWVVDPGGDGEQRVPDPASRWCPEGPAGPCEVVDPLAFTWQNEAPRRAWADAVISEIHVGAFTPEGTFASAARRLQELAATGIDTVQLMPIACFPGRFGWGYDGVLPYAPHWRYGSPDEFRAFVDEAHRLGLAVMLDIVHNHFGPEGNFLPRYAPGFFTDRHHTPWGQGIAFDGPHASIVREFFVRNALHWIGEYRLDGLRFDAVHQMKDDSDQHILSETARRLRAAFPDRALRLVLENEHNEAPRLGGGPDRFDAQWNDDFHHAMHVLLTGESHGYYGLYAGDPLAALMRSATGHFVRTPSADAPEAMYRGGALPFSALVNFLENHDQIGNRAFGERLSALAPEPAYRLATALLLLGPWPVMLFMGEEHGATQPFLYFADWSGPLRDAVRDGRRREFAAFPQFAAGGEETVPDPCDPSTFEAGALDWSRFDTPLHRQWHALHSELIALRRRELSPRLAAARSPGSARRLGERAVVLEWQLGDRRLQAVLNLGDRAVHLDAALDPVQPLFETGEAAPRRLGAWAGRWGWLDR